MKKLLLIASICLHTALHNNVTAQAPNSLNARVLNFAKANLGRQVGNGECWTLAFEALRAVGARHDRAHQYIFGRAVAGQMMPGDIVQFKDCLFKGSNYWTQMLHHTAVVHSRQEIGIYRILHQNVGGNRRVQFGLINIADLRSGILTAYRPLANTPASNIQDKAPPTIGKEGRVLVRMPFCRGGLPVGVPQSTPEQLDPNLRPESSAGIRVITVGGSPKRCGKVNGGRDVSLFFDPHTLWIDKDGNCYISEHWNHGVRKITAGDFITSEVANHLHHATGLCGDSKGNLYVTRFYHGDVVRISPDGQRKVMQSGFNRPCAVRVDEKGTMWVANTYSAQIIRITPNGRRTIWKGMQAHHIALGSNGDLYVACQSDQTVRKIGVNDTPRKAVEIIAGKPNQKGHIDGAASQARFSSLSGIAVSASGNIYVGDQHAIRRISPEGQVSTIAGKLEVPGVVDGPADKARFSGIAGLAIDSKGNLWVANRDKVVRQIINIEKKSEETGESSNGLVPEWALWIGRMLMQIGLLSGVGFGFWWLRGW